MAQVLFKRPWFAPDGSYFKAGVEVTVSEGLLKSLPKSAKVLGDKPEVAEAKAKVKEDALKNHDLIRQAEASLDQKVKKTK